MISHKYRKAQSICSNALFILEIDPKLSFIITKREKTLILKPFEELLTQNTTNFVSIFKKNDTLFFAKNGEAKILLTKEEDPNRFWLIENCFLNKKQGENEFKEQLKYIAQKINEPPQNILPRS